MCRSIWFPVGCLILAAALLGCRRGDIATVPVKGTVTLDGKAVEGATVTFNPADQSGEAWPAVGLTDAGGNFTLETPGGGAGAAPGNYVVSITKAEGEARSALPTSQEEAQKQMQERMKGGGHVPKAGKAKDAIPAVYGSPTTSRLPAEVKAKGDNTFTFALKSSGGSR